MYVTFLSDRILVRMILSGHLYVLVQPIADLESSARYASRGDHSER